MGYYNITPDGHIYIHVWYVGLCHHGRLRHKLSPHPFVELEPCGEAFAVMILKAKEPGFPQSDCLHYLNISIST